MTPKNELSLDEVRTFAATNSYFKWVQLTGGEPFLRRDLFGIAKAFVTTSDPYIVSIPTNSLCEPNYVEETVKQILELNIARFVLTLSLDGYGPMHDTIRGIPGNYDKVVELYDKLRGLTGGRFMLVFGYTISKLNQGKLSETVSVMGKELGVTPDDFHINLAQTSANYYTNEDMDTNIDKTTVLADLEWIEKAKRKRSWFTVVEKAYLRGLVKYVQTGHSPIRSRELDVSCYMDSFGRVYPSIMSNMAIGNIRNSGYDLMRLWNNDVAKRLRLMHKQNSLTEHWTSCEAYQTVLGNLPGSWLNEHK
jgi:MoaA/NifB/PqqE/SkfB family radical SAM enzyme